MNWIKENKFVSGLGGVTLLGMLLLYFVGSHFSTAYDEAKGAYEIAASDVDRFVKLPLYPNAENKAAKRKAIDEYRRSVESLQNGFERFRPKEIKNITPQEFTTNLLAAHAETRKAFEGAKTVVPEAYFVGFEGYKDKMAAPGNTGILNYQLDAIKALMLDLAKSKPTELKNLHRPALPEEEGKTYTPGPADVARAMPLEITFTGKEESVRQAFTALSKIDTRYMVIRSVRISNMKKDPPKASDAKFDKPAPAPGAAAATDPFGGGFVLPDEAAPATPDAAVPPAAPAPKAADTSRILSQVLGDEQLQVFVRLDVLQFLPTKKLP
jgi:hypothetical protein